MNDTNQLFSRCTADTATLYWDKPEGAGAEAAYAVLLDGAAAGTVTRTHFTAEGLAPDTEYRAEVRMGGETVCAGAFRTGPRLSRLDVRDFGAAGDGAALDTAALQRAIDACGPGQEVYLPAGVWRTGALRLHSDMALYLEEGAVLQGTEAPEDYLPMVRSRFEGIERECYSSLLTLGELDHAGGPNCENVLIYGKGTIASGGQALALHVIEREQERLKEYLAANAALVADCDREQTIPGRARPRLIQMANCRNIRVSGLTLKDGASWNVHMIYCDDIVTDHCAFVSKGVWNGDGWDPDSSENCTLFASTFDTGDDAVAVKSGKNPEGNQINRPCRQIRVFDCRSDFGLGIALGSEISGGIEDVMIWDCDLAASAYGMQIKGTKKRGGYVRRVTVRDCVLPRVMVHPVTYNDDGLPAPQPPVLEQCRFEGLRLTGCALPLEGQRADVYPIELKGFDTQGFEARGILFRNCEITGGLPLLHLNFCRGVTIENLSCRR